MRDLILRSFLLLLAVAMSANAMNINTDENPLLSKWEGPYGGVPPFDRATDIFFAIPSLW